MFAQQSVVQWILDLVNLGAIEWTTCSADTHKIESGLYRPVKNDKCVIILHRTAFHAWPSDVNKRSHCTYDISKHTMCVECDFDVWNYAKTRRHPSIECDVFNPNVWDAVKLTRLAQLFMLPFAANIYILAPWSQRAPRGVNLGFNEGKVYMMYTARVLNDRRPRGLAKKCETGKKISKNNKKWRKQWASRI